MSSWFPPHNRGRVFGLWSTNLPLGNAAGAQLSNLVLNGMGWNWEAVLWAASMLAGTLAVVILLFLYEKPPQPEERRSFTVALTFISSVSSESPKEGVSFWTALTLPG